MTSKLTCAVVIAVGPGHETLFNECATSVRRAFEESNGGFSNLIALRIDDPQGKLGRARVRNLGVDAAATHGADWILLLDADDLLSVNAFRDAQNVLGDHEAVWGMITRFNDGDNDAVILNGQVPPTEEIGDLLKVRPELALQTGHFIKVTVAKQFPFDEQLDGGVEFRQFLEVWKNVRCAKIAQPLSLKRIRRKTGEKPLHRSAERRELTRNRIEHGIIEGTSLSTDVYRMNFAIFGAIGTGTRELAAAMSIPKQRLILDEPAILANEWARHLHDQLRDFGLELGERDWNRADYLSFQEFFEAKILPFLASLSGWGIRTTRFEGWRELLQAYPADTVLLCVRDIRDIVLSHVDVATRMRIPIDRGFIERRTLMTAACLIDMHRSIPHELVRYEDLVASTGLLTLADRLGIELSTDDSAPLLQVGGTVNRHRDATHPQLLEFVDRVWQQCDEYCQTFNYERPRPANSESPVLRGTHWSQAPQNVTREAG